MKHIFRFTAALCASAAVLSMCSLLPASAAAEAYTLGDFNRDGIVNLTDAQAENADLDENGRINAGDLTLLKRMLLNN